MMVKKVNGKGGVSKFTHDQLRAVPTGQAEQDMFEYHQIGDSDKDGPVSASEDDN